ncbi:haloacid dehalogenase-like hydrolase (had) superfamily protein [Vairimorpha necatrix]|uniref:Haloacid dehalogenase-like hydrolase (Had) superfamily protein n=1 Tax=Vairimorpha necatrix TaxID=6039 RepID=A0AAX4JAP6_9MICR
MTIPCKIQKYITIHHDSLAKYKESLRADKNEPVFLFDIDDTLYKMSSELHKAEFNSWKNVFNKLNSPRITEKGFWEVLKSSPMTGAGILQMFNKTAKEAEDMRGHFEYKNFINKDFILREALSNIKYKKYCFTNNTKLRSQSILQCLGIEDCFDGIICIDDTEMGTKGKPFNYAYEFIIELLNLKDNQNVYFFDDSDCNIEKAKEYYWNCYKIERNTNLVDILKKINRDLKVAGEH